MSLEKGCLGISISLLHAENLQYPGVDIRPCIITISSQQSSTSYITLYLVCAWLTGVLIPAALPLLLESPGAFDAERFLMVLDQIPGHLVPGPAQLQGQLAGLIPGGAARLWHLE